MGDTFVNLFSYFYALSVIVEHHINACYELILHLLYVYAFDVFENVYLKVLKNKVKEELRQSDISGTGNKKAIPCGYDALFECSSWW